MQPATGNIRTLLADEEARADEIEITQAERDYLRHVRKTERAAALAARRSSSGPIKFHYAHKRRHG